LPLPYRPQRRPDPAGPYHDPDRRRRQLSTSWFPGRSRPCTESARRAVQRDPTPPPGTLPGVAEGRAGRVRPVPSGRAASLARPAPLCGLRGGAQMSAQSTRHGSSALRSVSLSGRTSPRQLTPNPRNRVGSSSARSVPLEHQRHAAERAACVRVKEHHSNRRQGRQRSALASWRAGIGVGVRRSVRWRDMPTKTSPSRAAVAFATAP